MHQPLPLQLLTPRDRSALTAAARRRAIELREQARQDFWNAVARRLRSLFAAARPTTR
ncbi:hypothetical protein [Aquabacterium humicola]|uniref:hypothetical protein n=1 Tax=Aquabacterium humicola TaxID=3237377 RepID=UPI002542904D|nr:hypothetical protein [Rubrivivax pictus]